MRKFILVENNHQVALGDTLINRCIVETPFGPASVEQKILVTEDIIPKLIDNNIIKEVPAVNVLPEEKMNIEYYINNIANRLGLPFVSTSNILSEIERMFPTTFFNIILKEIAVEIDKNYPDHIQESPEIFVVSSLNGRITKANKAVIKSYNNFAAFRSIEDARVACRIMRKYIKKLFN